MIVAMLGPAWLSDRVSTRAATTNGRQVAICCLWKVLLLPEMRRACLEDSVIYTDHVLPCLVFRPDLYASRTPLSILMHCEVCSVEEHEWTMWARETPVTVSGR